MNKIILLLKKIKKNINIMSKKSFYYLCCMLPIKNNWIIADNFNGNKFDDNPGSIINKLIRNNNKIIIFWTLNNNNFNSELPSRIIRLKYYSFKYVYILARSKVWIDNVRMPINVRKRKKQFYIQTWHGGLGFKKIEKDATDTLTNNYIKCAINDSKNINLLLTNCKWQEDYFRKNFWYDGEILVDGLPRNDILVNNSEHDEIIKKVHQDLNIDKDTKIILYAPTFRNNHSFECYNINFYNLISVLEKKYSCKWKLLIRLHPNMSNYKFDCDNAIDVTGYPNLNYLLIASNLLITDYSSIIFDFALQRKPALIYATDIDNYKKERGFALDLNSVPFPISTNNEELFNCLENYEEKKYLEKLQKFFINNGLNETGHVSENVANIILKNINK